ILDIEHRVYEPVRRTPPQHFRPALEHPDSVVTVAEIESGDHWHMVGFGVGAPLEVVADIEEGPDRDLMLGHDNTLYSVSITVAPEMQGRGVGRAIKTAQLREAMRRKRSDGSPRFRHVTGRNRVGHTASMRHLNRVFGAHIIKILGGQYADPEGQAAYYRIPLPPYAPLGSGAPVARPGPSMIEARSVAAPVSSPPDQLRRAHDAGLLYGPTVNKLTIMNYVTPAVVRGLEWVQALLPEFPRLYLTSSRDETVDKSLRILRYHRKHAQVAIGLAGGYVGHTSAAARSLTDPEVQAQGRPVFDWPRIPHPGDGLEPCLAALHRAVEAAGGPDQVFGLFVELVGERSGRVLSDGDASALRDACNQLGIPIVAVEGATAFYRSGRGPFASSGCPLGADLLTWWGGAQTGYIHVRDPFRVDPPLTMVSTWDGDELSLVRESWILRALRGVEIDGAIAALAEVDTELDKRGFASRGAGLYRVIEAGPRAEALRNAGNSVGLRLRRFPSGRVVFCPGLDVANEAVQRLAQAARRMA
ncbi:MAG: hypothetical protein KJO07_02190, partial [Deltaproteobacteria bacterium]|nr:hypothetical protein [Deltaproteobacteria bacterium]